MTLGTIFVIVLVLALVGARPIRDSDRSIA